MTELISEVERKEAFELCCESKAEELRLIGYEYVTGKEVWECVCAKYVNDGHELAVHRIVNDIFSLKAAQFMNFVIISAYRRSGLA